MSNEKIVDLTTRIKSKLEQTDLDTFNHIADNFEDYLDYWLDSIADLPEEKRASIAGATYVANPKEEFIPEECMILLANDERVVCLYSDMYHDNIMSMLGVEDEQPM